MTSVLFVKKLRFTVSKSSDIESWNIIRSYIRKDLLVENILKKTSRSKSVVEVSRLNI